MTRTTIHFELIVRGGTLVTPNGIAIGDVGVRAGKIAMIGDLAGIPAMRVIDARGLHVLPGVIDSQVHFREPGAEHKEDLATGTTAAVLGGVTCVLEMPNTNPSTTTAEALADKLRRIRGRARCDIGFFVGATGAESQDLSQLEALPGCAGVKVFMGASTGDLLVRNDAALASVLANGRRRIAVHAEDQPRLEVRKPITAGGVGTHSEWRDAESAFGATWRLLALARRFGRRVHVLHLSTAEELSMLEGCRDIATCEVTPQHLTLAAPDCYERLGTLAQMNPPIRSIHHQNALWEAVSSGVIDVIGSDHAPHTLEEKSAAYPQSPSGMPGVQTLLPVMLNHVAAGRLTLSRLVDLVCSGPARVWGIASKGRLAAGYDADLTLVDLKAEHTLRNADMASRVGWTPFDGMTVTGKPVATVVRGHLAMKDGQVVGSPTGMPARFVETLVPIEPLR